MDRHRSTERAASLRGRAALRLLASRSRRGARSTGRTCPDRPRGTRGERLPLPPHQLHPGRDRHPRLPEDHGRQGRAASALFGIPLQQTWSYGNTGDFAPTYYLQTDAPLYYYSFTDAFIAMAYRSLTHGGAGALRSDDHRLQPRRHVRRRSHPARAHDLPRRLLGHRRVHHPQGVRLVEDRGRHGEPHRTRRSTAILDFAGEVGLVVHPPQRHRHAVSRSRARSRTRRAQLRRAVPAASRRPRSSGRTAASAASCARSQDQLGVIERALADPGLAHVSIDISWDEIAKYIVATPEIGRSATADADQPPSRPLPVRHRRGGADGAGEAT